MTNHSDSEGTMSVEDFAEQFLRPAILDAHNRWFEGVTFCVNPITYRKLFSPRRLWKYCRPKPKKFFPAQWYRKQGLDVPKKPEPKMSPMMAAMYGQNPTLENRGEEPA